jgi:hypothetical protein
MLTAGLVARCPPRKDTGKSALKNSLKALSRALLAVTGFLFTVGKKLIRFILVNF